MKVIDYRVVEVSAVKHGGINASTDITPIDAWHCPLMAASEEELSVITQGLPCCSCVETYDGRPHTPNACEHFNGTFNFDRFKWLPENERITSTYAKCMYPIVVNAA
jgi:hypothetical protein